MKLSDYILEIELEADKGSEAVFNTILKQVFTKEYLAKIEKIIVKTIKFKYGSLPSSAPVATQGRTIIIDKEKYDKIPNHIKTNYILHEFIHILQNTKSFLVLNAFKEIHLLTNELMSIFKKNSVKPYSVFLTGQNQNIGRGGKMELVSYLMNNSFNPSALTIEGKKLFKNALINSDIFNTSSNFWKLRLNRF